MRPIISVLLVVAVAWGVHHVLREPDAPPDAAPPPTAPPAGTPTPDTPPVRPRATTGTLIIRVRTPAGEVPEGAEAGHELLGDPRWARVDAKGRRAFTDVPVGPVDALARAPGHEPARQRREIVPGVATEVVLILREEDP